jgi:hypothetical protein
MKVKIIAIDWELSPRLKRAILLLGLPAAAIVALCTIASASVPVAFTKNAPLKADDLNADFQNLDSRVTSLETTVAASHVATADNATHASSADNATSAAVATAVAAASVRIETSTCTPMYPGTAAPTTDCACNANEIAIGGGGWSGAVTGTLNESRNLGATGGAASTWRVSCLQNGARVLCSEPFAICLAVH